MFWKRFNSFTNALPDLDEKRSVRHPNRTDGEAGDLITNQNNVSARYQEFYFGTVSECYGGAWIVGLEYADAGCQVFDDAVNGAFAADKPLFFTPPTA